MSGIYVYTAKRHNAEEAIGYGRIRFVYMDVAAQDMPSLRDQLKPASVRAALSCCWDDVLSSRVYTIRARVCNNRAARASVFIIYCIGKKRSWVFELTGYMEGGWFNERWNRATVCVGDEKA